MIVLGIDTSTKVATVGLAVGERVYERAEAVTTYSERLLGLVEELFVEAGLRPSALGGIACGAGPGSFTGLRIGLSTCKGLCLGTGAPLVMISSLEVLAARAPAGASVLVAFDAFRGDVYAGLFDVDDQGRPQPRTPALAAFSCAPDALAGRLVGPPPRHYAGDGFVTHPRGIPSGATPIDGATAPRARELLFLAGARFRQGSVDDPRTAAPSYVRASAPEEARR